MSWNYGGLPSSSSMTMPTATATGSMDGGYGGYGGTSPSSTSSPASSAAPASANAYAAIYAKYQHLSPVIVAHGAIMVIAFGVLMATAAGLLRVRKAGVRAHVIIMSVSYVMMLVGFGMGVYLAYNLDLLMEHHSIIGMIVVPMLLLQPLFGYLAHRQFKITGRNMYGLLHRWAGRALITVAVINGGFGLQLHRRSWRWILSYSLVASLFVFGWWTLSIIDWVKYRRHCPKGRPINLEKQQSPLDGPADMAEVDAQHQTTATRSV